MCFLADTFGLPMGVPRSKRYSYNQSDVGRLRCCAGIPIRGFSVSLQQSAGCTAWCVRGGIGPTCLRVCVPTCSVATSSFLRLTRLEFSTLVLGCAFGARLHCQLATNHRPLLSEELQ
jgi:hypothetical protein